MEVLRDVGAQHKWDLDIIAQVERRVVIHEIGHQFGLKDDIQPDKKPEHVMWSAGREAAEANEDLAKDLPAKFRDEDIRIIREFGSGKKP